MASARRSPSRRTGDATEPTPGEVPSRRGRGPGADIPGFRERGPFAYG
ncbi:hypothetical protein STXM2123_60 [Streptomyces sp. F-3]|nr:hypothetical protein STXM2123_60 [Streptomyces sp. F-3]